MPWQFRGFCRPFRILSAQRKRVQMLACPKCYMPHSHSISILCTETPFIFNHFSHTKWRPLAHYLISIRRPWMFQCSLQWRHNEHDGVSNHQPHHWLLNPLFRRRSNKTSKPRFTGLCVGNSPMTGEFAAKMASNAEMFPFDDVIVHCDFGGPASLHADTSTHWYVMLTKLY